ncbi:unnamed protein product, partial [Meganyctiphanes norvegica]
FKAGLETDSWTLATHLSIWGSIAMWFIFVLVYSQFWPMIPVGAEMTQMYKQVLSSPLFWFGLILIPMTSLLLDIVVKVMRNTIAKSQTEQVRECEAKNKDPTKVIAGNRLTETARLLKNVFRRSTRLNPDVELAHGYAFSQEEHGVMGQGEIIRQYDTTQPKPGGF